MRIHHLLLILVTSMAIALAASACSDDETVTPATTTTTTTSITTSLPLISLRVEPTTAQATVDIAGAAASPIPFAAYFEVGSNAETDVTDTAEWSSSNDAIATVDAGLVTPAGIAGEVTITATHETVSATATVSVQLVGDLFLDGTDATTKATFDGAAPDPDSGNAPIIEYPEDGVVLPGNLPPIEAQWGQVADNAVYRLRLSNSWLEVAFYTTARELLFPADAWASIRASSPDEAITVEVDGLGANQLLRSSAPRMVTVSADIIDESSIYVWQTSTGSFRVIDIIAGTDVPLPTNSAALGSGQPCSGCHRISRDGKRFAFSYNSTTFQIGTLAYDETQQSYLEKVTPQPGVRGTYATFNPLEDTTRAAMLLTVPDDVPQNSYGDVRLEMRDPDTNALITSNISATVASLDAATGHGASMPDWSPDGGFAVFVAYDKDTHFVRELGDDVVLGSIVEASVTYDSGGSFTFGAPNVLVAANPADNPDIGANNFLPTISPDGSAVAFTRAGGWWPIKTQQSLVNLSGQIMLVRRSDKHVFELIRGSNGAGTSLSSSWPQWAPSMGTRYAWLAYASERAYGHRLTTASPENGQCGLVQGQQQCKQMWITAIDRDKLGSGSDDPSSAPFWIPGQTLSDQYVSPQWTKSVLPDPR